MAVPLTCEPVVDTLLLGCAHVGTTRWLEDRNNEYPSQNGKWTNKMHLKKKTFQMETIWNNSKKLLKDTWCLGEFSRDQIFTALPCRSAIANILPFLLFSVHMLSMVIVPIFLLIGSFSLCASNLAPFVYFWLCLATFWCNLNQKMQQENMKNSFVLNCVPVI